MTNTLDTFLAELYVERPWHRVFSPIEFGLAIAVLSVLVARLSVETGRVTHCRVGASRGRGIFE